MEFLYRKIIDDNYKCRRYKKNFAKRFETKPLHLLTLKETNYGRWEKHSSSTAFGNNDLNDDKWVYVVSRTTKPWSFCVLKTLTFL